MNFPERSLDDQASFLTLVLEGDRRRAGDFARRVFEQRGVHFLYEEVVRPALREVGELWQQGRISIADEHLATAVAQSAVAALYPAFPWPIRGPRALIACAQGERHDFGARMVADLLALDGWNERFLGADVPVEALVQKVRALEPKLLGISVTLRMHLASVRAAIRAARESFPPLKVLVGGLGTEDLLGLAASVEADAAPASASMAVEIARAWK